MIKTASPADKVRLLTILFGDEKRRGTIETIAEEIEGLESELEAWAFELARLYHWIEDHGSEAGDNATNAEEALAKVPDWIRREIES